MACPSIILRFSVLLCGVGFARGHNLCVKSNMAINEAKFSTPSIATRYAQALAITAVLLVICLGCSTGENRESLEWYQESAEKGYPEAQYNLGVLYANGRGVKLSHTEAVKWYRLAADQGLANAQFNLGVSYANGIGIPKNHVNAYMWWSLAKAQGHDVAAKYMLSIERNMVPSDISRAQQLAENWWRSFNEP